MMLSAITFPNLGIDGPLQNRVYDFWKRCLLVWDSHCNRFFAGGHLCLPASAEIRFKKRTMFWTCFLYVVPAAIIGARAYYCIFTGSYSGTIPFRASISGEGSMAIYGGVIGGVLALLLYSKLKRSRPACYWTWAVWDF